MASAYPLEWPQGWQRTPSQKRWASSQFQTTFDKARRDLNNELRLPQANQKLSPAQIRLLRLISDGPVQPNLGLYRHAFRWDTCRSLVRLTLAKFAGPNGDIEGMQYSGSNAKLRITEAGIAALKDL